MVLQCSIFLSASLFHFSLNSPAQHRLHSHSCAAGWWESNNTLLLSSLSSLGFHEAMRGCSRPHWHPGSPLCWRPLGVATSRRTPTTSSQLLWRDAWSQHPIRRSSQTNLRYHCCSHTGAGFKKKKKKRSSHKQQKLHQFRDWRIGIVKMLALRLIPRDAEHVGLVFLR